MPWELFQLPLLLPAFLLVFFRTGAMLFAAPIFSSLAIPVRLRIAMALTLAFLTFPLVLPEVPAGLSLAQALGAVAGELMIGLILGFGMGLIFFGLEVAGSMIEREAGMALAEAFNPLTEQRSSILAQIFTFVTFLVFLAAGGHLAIVRALLDSFRTVPVLTFRMSSAVPDVLLALLQTAMVMGLRIAAPALVALFIASLVMGFIMRTVPQINILTVGFAIRVVTALFVAMIAIRGLPPIFLDAFNDALEALPAAFVSTGD